MSSFNSREEAVHYLINARVHPRNASCTKKILTGLSAQENGDFTSVVKIINHSFFGIRFTKDAWEAFKFCFKYISEYFNTKNSTSPQKKTFNGISLTYTATFRTKTIVLDRENSPSTSLLDSDDENSTYSKKRKLYTPAIVM